MKSTNDNGLSDLWTAEKANERALFDMWHECPYFWENKKERQVECVVPDAETAKAYIEARRIRECVTVELLICLTDITHRMRCENIPKLRTELGKRIPICATRFSSVPMERKAFAMFAERFLLSHSSMKSPNYIPALSEPV